MDDVIFQDIPVITHKHNVQWEDIVAIVIGAILLYLIIQLLIIIINKFQERFPGETGRHTKVGGKIRLFLNKVAKTQGFENVVMVLIYLWAAFLCVGVGIYFFDLIFGVDKTYRKIISKFHQTTKEEIYHQLNFKEPDVILDTLRVESFIFSQDSITNSELRKRVDSLYQYSSSSNTFIELYFLASMNSFPQDIQDFFYKQSLLAARNKYETLHPILQHYVVKEDIRGMLKIDSLAREWKWERGPMSESYYPQDYLRTKCLYYAVKTLEESFPVPDSTASKIFKIAEEGYYVSRDLTDNYSPICLYFQGARARYAYQIGNPRAEKYTDQLIERSTRWDSILRPTSPHLFSPDRGGDVPGYYALFFTDPFFLRYKSLLRAKKYRKAALVLETISSITKDITYDPDNPYSLVHDSLQPQLSIPKQTIKAYAKYDLASISENARLRKLRRQKDASKWMTGAFLTGVNYLSPTESVWGTLEEYVLNGNVSCSEVVPYMSINYNNYDPRWVYNTALFLKGAGIDFPILIENAVKETKNSELKEVFSVLKTEKVFNSALSEADIRNVILDSLLQVEFSHNIKDILSGCFQSYLDIQKKLGDHECAVEVVKVPSLDFTEDVYKAVILHAGDQPPILVDLASAKDINEVIGSGSIYGSTKRGLYHLVWIPIAKHLGTSKTIYFSPDGSLCSVNISAIRDDSGTCLKEHYNIRQCVSTKYLKGEKRTDLSSIFLFGGIRYDDADMDDSPSLSKFIAYRGGDYDALGTKWEYLPATAQEVEFIDREANGHGIISNLFKGTSATEKRFKSLTGEDVDILHIATHGFYFNRQTAAKMTFFEQMILEDYPLNRCGLILSGGQKAWSGYSIPPSEEDGILLGSEIARMDLSSVNIVVLSACNTGLGDITYEGAWGLQKAFKQAGVKSIIMTLGKVDDNATRNLMIAFYRNMFAGMSIRDAFDTAINTLQQDPAYSKPEYWAPFVLLE